MLPIKIEPDDVQPTPEHVTLLFTPNEEQMLVKAPCLNGVIGKGCEVMFGNMDHIVQGVVAKGNRAFVHLVNLAEPEIETIVPATILNVS